MTRGGVRRIARRGLTASLAFAALACSAGSQRGPLPPRQPSATVRLDNRSPSQVTVYAVRSGQRVRLGEAVGSTTTVLRIPESVLTGTTALRFQIDPLGGSARTTSYEIMVSPGDQVMLIYP